MPEALLITNHVPPSRVAPYAALCAQHDVAIALFGGRNTHAAQPVGQLPFEVLQVSQRSCFDLAASGRYPAVVASTNGRTALPASYAGARRAGVPFVLWATLWAQPRGPAGIAGYPLVRHVYRHADAVATYGPHVSAYVRARGARNVFAAPQAVDNSFWSQPVAPAQGGPLRFVFAGRLEEAKGVGVLLDAWQRSGVAAQGAELVFAGDGPLSAHAAGVAGVTTAGMLGAEALRRLYAGAAALVLPSIATRTFREPWGLVVNEAFNQALPVIATDAVGAVAGGLVRDGRNGLVVAAGDAGQLAGAIGRLAQDAGLRARLGAAARLDVQPYTAQAWVDGMWAAISAARGQPAA